MYIITQTIECSSTLLFQSSWAGCKELPVSSPPRAQIGHAPSSLIVTLQGPWRRRLLHSSARADAALFAALAAAALLARVDLVREFLCATLYLFEFEDMAAKKAPKQ